MSCYARQYSDQMMCGPCGLQWDVKDPEPPECKRIDRRSSIARRAHDVLAAKFEKRPSGTIAAVIPAELPDELADAMNRAYNSGGVAHREAMRRAYRLFLDSLD